MSETLGEETASTNFDERQARRKRILDRVILASQVVAVLYLAIHLNVTYLAWREDGWINAAVTLITLGFGDLYWAVRWLMADGSGAAGGVALFAALVCFASWIFRPWFNRWANTFALDMIQDSAAEFSRMAEELQTDDDDCDNSEMNEPGINPDTDRDTDGDIAGKTSDSAQSRQAKSD